MLCSECRKPIKPVVALDIDGTLGDYHDHLVVFTMNYLGKEIVDGEPYAGDEPYRVWFTRTFGVDTTTFREIKLAYRQGGLKRTMPKFRGAAALTVQLRQDGFEVWLTTTRPYLRLDGVDRDTRHWLDRHCFQYDHLLYDEDKYDMLAEAVDPDRVLAVLDDEVAQLAKAELALGAGCAILRATGYNRRAVWAGDRVKTLEQAYTLITNRLEQWQHGQ